MRQPRNGRPDHPGAQDMGCRAWTPMAALPGCAPRSRTLKCARLRCSPAPCPRRPAATIAPPIMPRTGRYPCHRPERAGAVDLQRRHRRICSIGWRPRRRWPIGSVD